MSLERVREYLKDFGMDSRIIEFSASSATVEEAAKAAHTEAGRIAKTMSFYVGETPVLILMAGDVKVDNHKYKQYFHTKAKMIPQDALLQAVGHEMGGVCPFAVRSGAEVYLDESLRRFTTVFPAAGSSNSAIELSIPELEKTSRAKAWIDISKPVVEQKKRILLLCTGGTIASRKTSDGLAPQIMAEDILSYVPEASQICDIDALQVCNIDSTNMTPAHWTLLAETIQARYARYDGFVICHGTDTMAYTSAALSYMIQNSEKPIVITGAQKPIDMDTTDAKTNLLDSIIYAADEESRDVVIVFDGKVIAGTRAKKMRAKSYNAFSSVNFPELAVMHDGKIVRYIPQPEFKEPVRFYTALQDSVVVLKLIPGSRPDMLEYLFQNYDCIIMESFGVGGIPERLLNSFYEQMEKWLSKGKFVVMATQVVNEGSNMEVYEVGQRAKKDFNLIEAYDMTFEATVTKIMWLLKQHPHDYAKLRDAFYKKVNFDILYTR